ncbi:hypothetical protein SAMN05216226_10534 [Halovenus aranensis]|jgi:hypothetical protein|uniref:Uncharacterized protein n=1 Tax=Halovenus aranensis TaxID=890420 RepID=A0A1G8UPB4_9EURY|nr:hypothetical protein [Halovenus aranensis]SDJ55504.1 hypothetical protein SAMN05216226_10534 [Halovenus aranensis]
MALSWLNSLSGRRDIPLLAGVTVVELCLLAGYFLVRPERPTVLRYTLYPFIWINVALLAALHVDVPEASRPYSLAAAAIATLYFGVLLYLSGLLGVPSDDLLQLSGLVDIQAGTPGTERLHLVTEVGYVSIIPYRTVGYLVLSYLVYVTILDLSGSLLAGALGLFSCVGCAFPILVSLSAGLFGGTAVATAVYSAQFDISTVVFAVAVGLLYLRPGVDGTLGAVGDTP